MSKFALLPTALCIGEAFSAPSAIGYSEGAGRGRVHPVATLDSGSISHAQTLDITRAVGSPADILPGTPATVFIPNVSTKILLFQNRRPVMPVLSVSYTVETAAHAHIIKNDKSEIGRTGLG